MTRFNLLLYAGSVYAVPLAANNVTNTTCASGGNGPALPFIDPTGKIALLWTSIGLAVLTSFWQGLITTIVAVAEDQSMWTFRFRIARYEHWWWTVVSTMLFISFGLIVISFLSGNNNDSLGVLTLSTATAIAIVRYALPAWRNRLYTELRWLAWTGKSRTGIPAEFGRFCGQKADWMHILDLRRGARFARTPSDEWGWAIRPPKGMWQNPTALLQGFDEKTLIREIGTDGRLGLCVYDDGYQKDQVSLLWGESEGFRRRVSRAVNSMPSTLLNSYPSTYDGFNGTGLCLAMGILGRNKGLAPFALVFDVHDSRKDAKGIVRDDLTRQVSTELEATSAWFPRPNKVMRSYYRKVMEDQYSGLGAEYIAAAVELALIFLDCPPQVTKRWLSLDLEHQSIKLNQVMSDRPLRVLRTPATSAQLQTLYRASYASMILSINYFDQDQHHVDDSRRPDLICFALLWLAEGGTAPAWWGDKWSGQG
ncbi:hypothetical protein LshimejAT787_1301070 [Lyophyllum shimeji]|uniref:Uncharacterized protein n=1 Tax=Lyophyllum shimeji TaxID=47721 RepID=A0A9P3PX32_LYOSH|nr:hypothetical protein LshimejAT787_1301070 [Lyophyllum shimeji]